jgi:streptomycin 6-kinase
VFTAVGTDLVMERLYGPVLLDAVAAGDHDAGAAGRVLADLHTRLHAIPSRAGTPDERVLHLDLHPANVVLTARGPVLIDWTNATDGPPDLDVAQTAVILAQAAVEPEHVHGRTGAPRAGPRRRAARGRPLADRDRGGPARRGRRPHHRNRPLTFP